MIERSGNLIVISGPSGVGKSTLVKQARQVLPQLEFSVSCTTRQPRAGEVDGKDYFFLSEAEFENKVKQGEFLEYAGVFAHRYGTLKSEVISRLQRGADVILDIDVQGAKQIREAAGKSPELARSVHFVLIAPPSLESLESRLRGRASETEEQLQLRLGAAKAELANYKLYDYIIVNDELERAVTAFQAMYDTFKLSLKRWKGAIK